MSPAIAALRGDRAAQRRAQQAMEDACREWTDDPAAALAMAELASYGAGADLANCPQLLAMFTGEAEAPRLTGVLVDRICRLMRAEPMAHPPFRNGFNGGASTLQLARKGSAQLLLQAREPGEYQLTCATFSDAERHDAVLAGSATGSLVRISALTDGRATLSETALDLTPATRMTSDLTRDCLLVERVERRLVTLRLVRDAEAPAPAAEYERATGRLFQLSAGNLATSHRESMVALLGRMGRTDAAPVLADVARAPGDRSLRWHALRECLALDTAEGFAALQSVARDAADPLATDAGALRAQLVELHPELLALEAEPCPA